METDQGYDPLHDNPIQDDPLPPTRHLLTQRPGDDRMVEDHRRRLNERQATFERRCKAVLRQLWPGMEDSPEKMWPPIYVMRIKIQKQFEQWHRDNPVDELKPGYNKIKLDRWQIKEVIEHQPPWRINWNIEDN